MCSNRKANISCCPDEKWRPNGNYNSAGARVLRHAAPEGFEVSDFEPLAATPIKNGTLSALNFRILWVCANAQIAVFRWAASASGFSSSA